MLQRLYNYDDSAWIVGGDFNETLLHEEKEGGDPVWESQLQMFRNAMDDCGLQDLDFEGDMFTWSNRQGWENQINERLDRFVSNEAFLQSFPNVSVVHLNWAQSDHRPIY